MEQNNHVHSFSDTVVPSTCKQQGFTLHKCACGYEHKDNFKPLADHDFETVGGTEPTCTEGGSKTLRCKVCGVEKTEQTPASGHAWGDWNIQEYSTCTEEGKQFRFCGMCGLREDQTIPAKGHKLTNPKESETEEGMIEYFCENCGSTIVQPSAKSKAKSFFTAHKKGLKALVALFVVIAIASTLLLTVFAKPFHYYLAKIEIKLGAYTPAYYNLVACEDYKDAEELLYDFRLVYEEETWYSYSGGKLSDKEKCIYDEYGNLVSRSAYDANGMSKSIEEFEYEYDKKDNLLASTSDTSQIDCSYDKKGNLIKITSKDFDEQREYECHFEYDDDGNVIKKYGWEYNGQADNPKREFDYEYEYDKKGNRTLLKSYMPDGSLEDKIVYEYDKDDNLISMTRYDSKEEYYTKYEYTYDKRGNEMLYIQYDKNNEIIQKTEWEYDGKGELVYSAQYTAGGVLNNKYVREKNGAGSKGVSTRYDENGNGTVAYEMTFDKKGNQVLYVEYSDGKVSAKTEYEYDRFGNCIEKSGYRYDFEDRKTTFKDEYVYDKRGNCLEASYFSSYEYVEGYTAENRSTRKYTYDKKGNLISSSYYSDGVLSSKGEYKNPIIVYLPDNHSYLETILGLANVYS